MTWVIVIAASATNVSKTPTDSHLNVNLAFGEKSDTGGANTAVLLIRVGNGRPPGPVRMAGGWAGILLADMTERDTNAIRKTTTMITGEIDRV